MLHLGPHPCSPLHPVLVIAEIGVNHDGSVARALELVDTAKAAGADGVKLQVFRAAQLVNGAGVLAEYQKRTTTAESSADLLRRYELSEPDLRRVLDHARSLGLLAVATPFSLADVPVCLRLGLDALKTASPDVVNTPLLTAAARTGLPLLVSTGAATLEEIDAAHRLLSIEYARSGGGGGKGSGGHLLLHCVSSYPAPDDQAHLCFIPQLIRRYGPLIGYSDHATSTLAGAFAVAAGAVLLERHLTHDRAAPGPDHAASSDGPQLADYVRHVRLATSLRGQGPKRVLPGELDVRTVSRQSLVLARDLAPHEPLTESHLTLQRPGTGIPANAYHQALGRHPTRPLRAGTLLTWDMLHVA